MGTRMARATRWAVATVLGVCAGAGLSGCATGDEMCTTIRAQFAGISAPASLDQVTTDLAAQLAQRYQAVAAVAPQSSKAAWDAVAHFWTDFARAAGDTGKLAGLTDDYAEISSDVEQVKADTAACNLG